MLGFNKTMTHKISRIIGMSLLSALACTMALAQSCDLTKTLSQMDAASAKFKSLQADFVWDEFQAVVQEDDLQSGTIYFVRHGGSTNVAADIQKPAAKKLTFDGSDLMIYTPGSNEELIYSAAKNKDQVEGFLTLGFGGSGSDLQKNWDVTCDGTETIAGTQTVKLGLIAKQDSVKSMFSKVTIWIDPTRAISLKQVFAQPSGDKRTNTFTNIKENGSVDAGVFKIKTKPNPSITRK
jgi:outer membrane lipoprotein-sorting protein